MEHRSGTEHHSVAPLVGKDSERATGKDSERATEKASETALEMA